MGTLYEDQYTFLIISSSLLLRIENISDKAVEKIKTHILCSVRSLFNCVFYETMWKNEVLPNRPQRTMWHMSIIYWIPKAKNRPSEYVILMIFPLKQCLEERATMLGYRYIALPLVNTSICCSKL